MSEAPTKEQNASAPSPDQASAPRAGSAVAGGALSSKERTTLERAGDAFRKTFGRDPTADRGESCWLAGYAQALSLQSETEEQPSNVESLDERRKVLRAMDALEAMSEQWAESVQLDAMSANLARRPDINDRCAAIRALIVQAHMEGLYTGRTSLETDPPQSSEETRERCEFGGSYGHCILERGHAGRHDIPVSAKNGGGTS